MVSLADIAPEALAMVPREYRDPGREMAPEGPLDADLVFVGEAPGANEAETGRPFVGRAGDVLNEALAAAGIDREGMYITAVVKIRPPDNRDPHRAELDAWRPVLEAELALVDPQGVVTLGAVATRELLGTDRRITDLRGRVVDRAGYWILPTFHPAAVLYDPAKREGLEQDLQTARAKLADHLSQ